MPIILVMTVVLLAGCAKIPSTPALPPITVPLPQIAPDSWAKRGQVVERKPLEPGIDDPESVVGEAWWALYNSVSGVDGGLREVSGAFFIPRGNPPEGGWPVVSIAHGTTGIEKNCGPSRDRAFRGDAPYIRGYLKKGYAIAFTDYEGLGPTGLHPYLEPRTEAFNVIDSVRALREVSPAVSARWVALGTSQGGQAAWSANELNSYYGGGIDMLGTVALSPAANLTGLADLAWAGELTREQATYYPLTIIGLNRYNADLDPSKYIHGATAGNEKVLATCGSPVGEAASNRQIRVDLRPKTWQDVERLRTALQEVALPQRPLNQPMLVINGMRDETILHEWVSSAVEQSCRLGGRIEHVEIATAGHDDLTPPAYRTVSEWIADRFAGKPAPSNCPN